MMRWFNVSELSAFMLCGQFHENLWRQKRGPIVETSEALMLGTWAHQVMEGLMHGAPVQDFYPPVKGAEALHLALKHWHATKGANPPWDRVIMTETALRAELSSEAGLFGTPDAFVEKDGLTYHVQHKTLGASTPVHVFVAGIAVSWHESVYRWLAIENGLAGRASYGGTMVNVIRKLSLKRIEEEPDSALHIEFVPITTERMERSLDDITRVIRRIADGEVERNPASCCGRYGNKLCAYYDSCWRGLDLNGPYYTDSNPLARYEIEDHSA